MRIVWASGTFLAGVGAAIVFRFAPGHALPEPAFALFAVAAMSASIALIISRRRAAIALLCLVFILGAWRGSAAVDIVNQPINQSTTSSQDSLTSVSVFNPLRRDISATLSKTLGTTDAALPIALLIGDRSGIDDELARNFRSAGLAHLLAISGLHVSLIGGIAMTASALAFGRRRAFYLLIPLTTVLIYAALAGLAPPVARAAIMFSIFVLGKSMGRGSHTLAALALAAWLMVAWEPEILASLSFQLSFTAMLGIAFVAPALDNFTEIAALNDKNARRLSLARRALRFVLGSLAVSFAAILGTLPLIALHFDAVPIWSALATLFAVPAMPILIISSATLAAIGQFPVPFVAEVVAVPVQATTTYLTRVAELFAYLPPTPVETGAWSAWLTIGYYAVFVVLILSWRRLSNAAHRVWQALIELNNRPTSNAPHVIRVPLGMIAAFLIAGIVGWGGASIAQADPKPYLSVHFLETTHGEAIFIETPSGNRMLIDGGGDANEIADTLTRMLPFTNRSINVVMLTHSDADHVGGLPDVIRRFSVDTIMHSGLNSSSDIFTNWLEAIENHDDINVAQPGTSIGLDKDVYLEVISSGCPDASLSCHNDNNASIVTRLHFGDVSFLLTGDIESSAEAVLASTVSNLHATVLKAPHHGSITSSTGAFIDAVDPTAVVIAVGSENRYGHPHPEVLVRLNNAVGEERVFRTDTMGTLEFRTDGQRLWIAR